MQHRASTAPERTSFGMGVVAVAVGVGYGVVDTIARHVHRHEDHPASGPTITLDPPRDVQVHAPAGGFQRVPA
jgi:hypothetical protein